MSKKFYRRMAALAICLAFLVSLAPMLNSAEKNTIKSVSLENLKASFRLLSYIFPFLPALSESQPDRGKSVEKIGGGNNGMISKSTDDQIANQPKTKD